jgi:hypothetical protein
VIPLLLKWDRHDTGRIHPRVALMPSPIADDSSEYIDWSNASMPSTHASM